MCRHLKGTTDDGLILKPNAALSIDCCVDADFCGLWGTEDPNEVACAKSRTGFVVAFASCPLLWVSKLQTEAALSTTEAELTALSQSMRELMPIRDLATEIMESMRMKSKPSFCTHSTVFEDNNGASTLATTPKMTPRSKHIAAKHWFFREHVHRGTTKVVKVNTKQNKADTLTKAMPVKDFMSIRKLLCGWQVNCENCSLERKCCTASSKDALGAQSAHRQTKRLHSCTQHLEHVCINWSATQQQRNVRSLSSMHA